MTTLREFAPYIGIALVVIAIAAVTARHKLPNRFPPKTAALVFAAAFLAFLGTGVGLRLHEIQVLNRPLTIGDIVRPELDGALPTGATVESWQEALEPLGLVWTSRDELLVDRPDDLLAFDDEFTGYMVGRVDYNGLRFTAVIGFEDAEISWFACRAAGLDEADLNAWFFWTCWNAAEIEEIDRDAGAEWVGSALSSPETETGGLDIELVRDCPVGMSALSIPGPEPMVNAQLTISRGKLC
ncbi:hypothetical protein GCM10009853_093160 [Glycomyces scopariae]